MILPANGGRMPMHPYRTPARTSMAPPLPVAPRPLWFMPRFVLPFFLMLLALATASCGPSTARMAAHTTILAAGSVTATLEREHQRVFREATNELRQRSASLADYNRDVAPMVAEFDERSEALQALSASLYAAAAIVDATRNGAGPAEYAHTAALTVVAIDRMLGVLERGSVLPPVDIPDEILVVTATLRGIAEARG